MIHDKTVLAVIPARGGSKGLPGKNILPLAGKPMIAWTIDAARGGKYIDRLIVSTDSEKIAKVAKEHCAEVPFIRPPELATDQANMIDVLLHSINKIEAKYDILLVLQPTSPLRKSEDIDSAIEYCVKNNLSSVVSVCQSAKPLHWHHVIDKNSKLSNAISPISCETNRQQFETTYIPNGAIFLAKTSFFLNNKAFYTDSTYAFIMSLENSVDIDCQYDMSVAELLLTN
jgi:CMP-N,N'-diacetyllegionaminic acid synthase